MGQIHYEDVDLESLCHAEFIAIAEPTSVINTIEISPSAAEIAQMETYGEPAGSCPPFQLNSSVWRVSEVLRGPQMSEVEIFPAGWKWNYEMHVEYHVQAMSRSPMILSYNPMGEGPPWIIFLSRDSDGRWCWTEVGAHEGLDYLDTVRSLVSQSSNWSMVEPAVVESVVESSDKSLMFMVFAVAAVVSIIVLVAALIIGFVSVTLLM